MSYLSISNLIIVAINLPMAILLFLSSKGRKANIILGYLCIAAIVWGFGSYNYSITLSKDLAVFWWQIANVGSILSTVFFYYFILSYLDISKRKLSIFVNLVTAFYLYLNFFMKNAFVGDLKFIFNELYYLSWPSNKITPYLIYYVAFYFLLLFYSFVLLIKEYVKTSGIRRMQMKYLISGMVIGFIGCHACFVPVFGFNVYPYLNIFIGIYTIPIGYAIVKYHLMDIRMVITRAGIFVSVYTLILGVPFYYAYSLGLWKLALWLMMVLATVGPFIYLYIQKRTEAAILQEQRQYQMTLQQASLGMGQIKELGKLLKLIVHIVTRAVGIEHSEVYLLHEDSKQYTLKASRGWSLKDSKQVSIISSESPLVQHLKEIRASIVYDEIEQYSRECENKNFSNIEEIIKQLDGGLIVPSFMDQKLIAILVLGRKKSGKLFTDDDMAVFTILANQAGLAIENAQFYERMKETHLQLIKAEKMATVGTMADGLSHQINNRLHAMGFIAGDALDTIKLKKKEKLSPDMQELMDEIEHSLSRIEDNVKRGGEIVEGLLKYTRKGSEGFEAINLNALLGAALEMAQFKIKVNDMNINRNFDDSIPCIKGNFTQLQEVFFNLIDNAYDAMMERKQELKEPEFKANLKISAKQAGNRLEILFQDNGMGVKKENIEKLFTPFFTTKLSSKKGTGLGLYVIRQIIEENHGGKVHFTSEYKQGSQTRILLPMAV